MWQINPETFLNKTEECLSYIKDNWDKIPLLNCVPDHNIADGQLVRFCGMIQDMPNPVYYYSMYEVFNVKTGLKEIRSGKYRDCLQCNENETLILDSENSQNEERQLYTCVTIPALNDWAKPKYVDTCDHNASSSNNIKRNAQDMDVDDETFENNKRLCTTNILTPCMSEGKTIINKETVPDQNNYSCIVHIYDQLADNIKVNDIIVVCGFIHFGQLSQDNEQPQVNIPRLHAVTLTLNTSFYPPCTLNVNQDVIFSEAKKLRSELSLILTQILLGDTLAADYVICHLIAHVYARLDCVILGKFSLNLSNIPTGNDYISELYKLISQLLSKTLYLPMSLEKMNKSDMIPRKNYETDRLERGMLQLSDHTHLVIDETKLQVGQLDEKGVRNVQALKCLIENQKLDYDFKFYTIEFTTDIPVLVLSEGKSLLPSDCHVVLNAEVGYSLEECIVAVNKYLQEPLLSQIRNYLAVIASVKDFTLPDHLHQTVENDLVEQRQSGEKKTSADDFHARLVLARLMSLSFGEKELTKSIWDKTGVMEKTRKLRLNIETK